MRKLVLAQIHPKMLDWAEYLPQRVLFLKQPHRLEVFRLAEQHQLAHAGDGQTVDRPVLGEVAEEPFVHLGQVPPLT